MNLFYACQNRTFKRESKGEYLWSPQKTADGKNNKGYINMSKVKRGDIIIHGAKQESYAVSIAKEDCEIAQMPEVQGIEMLDEREGYLVFSNYIILDKTLNMKDIAEWLKKNHKEQSAFTKNGTCKEIYLNNLDIEHAKFILTKIISIQTDNNTKKCLRGILNDILDKENSEYDGSELEIINAAIEDQDDSKVKCWSGKREQQELVNGIGSGRKKHKRSVQKAINALGIANYRCEYDPNDRIFERKNGKGYTEPHHLIPLSKYEDFEYSLDMEENIVSLCSHCHNLLHYGKIEDKIVILKKLFINRQDALKKIGLKLNNFNELLKYYK